MNPTLEGESFRGLLEIIGAALCFVFVAQLWQGWSLRGILQLLRGYNGDDGLIKQVRALRQAKHDMGNEILALQMGKVDKAGFEHKQ